VLIVKILPDGTQKIITADPSEAVWRRSGRSLQVPGRYLPNGDGFAKNAIFSSPIRRTASTVMSRDENRGSFRFASTAADRQ